MAVAGTADAAAGMAAAAVTAIVDCVGRSPSRWLEGAFEFCRQRDGLRGGQALMGFTKSHKTSVMQLNSSRSPLIDFACL